MWALSRSSHQPYERQTKIKKRHLLPFFIFIMHELWVHLRGFENRTRILPAEITCKILRSESDRSPLRVSAILQNKKKIKKTSNNQVSPSPMWSGHIWSLLVWCSLTLRCPGGLMGVRKSSSGVDKLGLNHFRETVRGVLRKCTFMSMNFCWK